MFILHQTHPRGAFWLALSRAARDAFLATVYVFPAAQYNTARYEADVPLADELRAFFG